MGKGGHAFVKFEIFVFKKIPRFIHALKGQLAPSPGQSEAAPWVMEIHRRLSP